jgi:hypothetical protein
MRTIIGRIFKLMLINTYVPYLKKPPYASIMLGPSLGLNLS